MVSLEFFIDIILPVALWLCGRQKWVPGIFPGGGGGIVGPRIGLTILPPSCANCLEIWEPQPPGTLRACKGIALPLLLLVLSLIALTTDGCSVHRYASYNILRWQNGWKEPTLEQFVSLKLCSLTSRTSKLISVRRSQYQPSSTRGVMADESTMQLFNITFLREGDESSLQTRNLTEWNGCARTRAFHGLLYLYTGVPAPFQRTYPRCFLRRK
jgi:hypothetical protein